MRRVHGHHEASGRHGVVAVAHTVTARVGMSKLRIALERREVVPSTSGGLRDRSISTASTSAISASLTVPSSRGAGESGVGTIALLGSIAACWPAVLVTTRLLRG